MKEDNLKDKKDEFEFKGSYEKKYENIKNLVQSAFNQLEKVQSAIENLEREERKSHYQNIPGTEGVFDGQYLIAEDGRKTEVPQNYASKSKLVYGDILKVFTDSGKQIFKQIDRVERKSIQGVMAKKEGKWYLLSDSGSYRISEISAEFNKAQLNDRASALIPSENQKVPFATLDRVYKSGDQNVEKNKDQGKRIPDKIIPSKKPTQIKKDPEENKKIVSKPKSKPAKGKIEIRKGEGKSEKIEIKKEEPSKEYISNIMEDDDLR